MIEQNSTPETDPSANPATDPELSTGTVPADSQATTETAPISEESFTKLDPKTLPPQLKASYDEMLRDYKTKTTSISERVKQETARAIEQYRQEAEAYRQIAQQEDFVKKWNEYVQQSQAQGTDPATDPKLKQLEAKFEEINNKIQLSELNQITESFADAVNEKGVKLHPDFDELNSLSIGVNGNGEEFSLLRACVELSSGSNPSERLSNGYKQAKQAYNAIFEAGKKAGMVRVQTKVQNGTIPPTSSTGDVLSVTDKKPRSAREALDMARKGLVVSRD